MDCNFMKTMIVLTVLSIKRTCSNTILEKEPSISEYWQKTLPEVTFDNSDMSRNHVSGEVHPPHSQSEINAPECAAATDVIESQMSV